MIIALQVVVFVMAAGGFTGVPHAHAEDDTCNLSERRFLTGHGRRSGTTVVVVEMRQQIKERSGEYVTASEKGREITLLESDSVNVKVLVKNSSPYDIAQVELQHSYSAASDGPSLIDVSSVKGAEFDRLERMFTIDRIASGETAEITLTVQVSGDFRQGISETSVELLDFTVLNAERRFPQRTSLSSVERHRQNVEKVGIGGKEVSCISGVAKVSVPLAANSSPPPPATSQDAPKVSESGSQRNIDFSVTPSASELLPGGMVTYTVRVTNSGREALSNILVDDRFSHSEQRVERDGGALVTDVGLHWLIEALDAGAMWQSRYTVRTSDTLTLGQLLTSDLRLYGSDLEGILPKSLTRTVTVRIVDQKVMPETGVDFSHLLTMALQIITGTIVAFMLFWIGLRCIILWIQGDDQIGNFS